MQSGRIFLALAACLVMASPCPAWGPGFIPEPWPSFDAPPPPPLAKPLQFRVTETEEVSVPESELRCLALTVYWEAGMEPRAGQLAVAHVVLNRVGRPGFANSVCEVVHQGGTHFPCQFHWYCSGRDTTPKDPRWWAQAQELARQALAEADPTEGALYFHLASLRPQWAAGRYQQAHVIGHHIFFGG